MTGIQRIIFIFNLVLYAASMGTLLTMLLFEPAHVASSRDVTIVGVLIMTAITASRLQDD
jgi:hypothetical protein